MALDRAPTAHQQAAIDWLVAQIGDECPLLALRGLAGTGKTTMIPALKAALEATGRRVTVGAPTHRAALMLRQKGIEADTVHSLALVPYFTSDYARAVDWLGDTASCRLGEQDMPHVDIEGIPWLIHAAVKPDLARAKDLQRARHYAAKKRLASVGIHGRDYFTGFGPKAGNGVLIIDEGSMVGAAMLALCQQAFPQIILVGDPGQLPPVKDVAQLSLVDGVEVTEIHRQAADSPVVQLAYRARSGEAFWQQRLAQGNAETTSIQDCPRVCASALLTAPLIVWKNETRLTCTHAIRAALGFTRERLAVGEPLVCRSTSPEDRSDGFLNNALFRVVEVDPSDPRRLVVEDALGQAFPILAHLEELDGDTIDPRAIPFRFAYCLTAHTAQGGEWPTVYLSLPDLLAFASFCGRTERVTERAQWTYTAITRAKETLCFLTTHTFDPTPEGDDAMATPKSGPTTAPMLMIPDEPPPSIVVDDIVDPIVPETLIQAMEPQHVPTVFTPVPPTSSFNEHEALLSGFCQALHKRVMADVFDQSKSVLKCIDAVYDRTTTAVTKLAEANEHTTYQLSNALTALQERGLTVSGSPYTATVVAMSPDGFQVTLAIQKPTAGELVEELGRLVPWLKSQNYGAVDTMLNT